MSDLEQLAQVIFQTAMASYDQQISSEEDPEARAMLAYHRDKAVAAARDYAAREARKALLRPVSERVH